MRRRISDCVCPSCLPCQSELWKLLYSRIYFTSTAVPGKSHQLEHSCLFLLVALSLPFPCSCRMASSRSCPLHSALSFVFRIYRSLSHSLTRTLPKSLFFLLFLYRLIFNYRVFQPLSLPIASSINQYGPALDIPSTSIGALRSRFIHVLDALFYWYFGERYQHYNSLWYPRRSCF